MTFGALFTSKGGTAIESFIIATFCFAGAAQFASLEFYNTNSSFILLFVTVFIINLRHFFYGISFLNMWSGWRKIYLFSAITDENFGISQVYSKLKPTEKDWLKIFGLNHFYWVFGCVVGSFIPVDFLKILKGADFALLALFVAILASSIKSIKVSNG
jgi:4-azaleucine resistance transporter AzlC